MNKFLNVFEKVSTRSELPPTSYKGLKNLSPMDWTGAENILKNINDYFEFSDDNIAYASQINPVTQKTELELAKKFTDVPEIFIGTNRMF